jgi:hypothetical protein
LLYDADTADTIKRRLFDACSTSDSTTLNYSGALSAKTKRALKDKLGIVHHTVDKADLDRIFGLPNQLLRASLLLFHARLMRMNAIPSCLVLVGGGMRGWKVADVVRDVFVGVASSGLADFYFQVASGGLVILRRFGDLKVRGARNFRSLFS